MTPPGPPARTGSPLPREERRRRTEAAILAAARELFAEKGFERTTIRAVAARAGIDPALVMQYYGNKEGLFAASARWQVDHKHVGHVAVHEIPHTALKDLYSAFEDPEQRDASLALLRSCLTHQTARGIVRDDVLGETQGLVAKTIGGDDAELRAALLASTIVGLSLGRYLLELPALKDATPESITRVVAPLLAGLTQPS